MQMPPPTVDLGFIESCLLDSPKLQGTGKKGSTTYYVIKGNKPITDRMIYLTTTKNDQVSLEFAQYVALRFKFMPDLLEWLKDKRNWKDGAYFQED